MSSLPPPPPQSRNVKPLVIGCTLLFVIFAGSCAVLYVAGTRIQEREAREAAAAKVRKDEETRKNAADAAPKLERQLTDYDTAIRARDWTAAGTAMRRATIVAEPYLAIQPTPAELTELLPRYQRAKQTADLRERLLNEYADLMKSQGEAARLSTVEKRPVEAERILKKGLETADRLIEEARNADDLVMPDTFEPAKRKAEMQKTLRSVSARAEEHRKDEREAAALEAVCGKKPVLGLDGGIFTIESALKKVAHDPDSIDVENCSEPTLYRDRCWVTTCDVRGKNAFGAKVLNRKRFSVSTLGVEEVR